MSDVAGDDRLYFRQLLSGRDFAQGDQMARQMVNFVYLIGDRATGEAVVVDPAYAVQDLARHPRGGRHEAHRRAGARTTTRTTSAGRWPGGVSRASARCSRRCRCRCTCRSEELPWVERTTGVGASHLVGHDSGDVVRVGSVEVELIHTPGHTPGSQCFLVDGRLVAGDTLFLDGCGRTDLPGADPVAMYESINNRLWPGFPTTPCSSRATSTRPTPRRAWATPASRTTSSGPAPLEEWMAMFGGR